MRDAACSAMLMKSVAIGHMRKTGMGLRCKRRELNDDQQYRRSNHSQKHAGRNHEQLLPRGPS
jgi:hypothetical protein